MLCCFYIIYIYIYIYIYDYIFRSVTVEKKGSIRKEVMNLSFYHRYKNNIPKHESKQHFHLIGLTHIQFELAVPSLNRPACGRGSLFLILFCDITSTVIRLWKTTRLIYRTEFPVHH